MDTASGAPIEIVDVLGGFVRLVQRSATLGGSVPLRAAQACTPLLEGNAIGRELILAQRIELVRSLGGLKIERFVGRDAITLRTRGALPMMGPLGMGTDGLADAFANGPVSLRRKRIELFTGLVARVPAGVRLRVSSTANRRPRSFRVEERFIDHASGYRPVVLSLVIEDEASSIVLDGEIATVIPLPDHFDARYRRLHEAPEVARAHVHFYDKGYFESKERGATRKYRKLVTRHKPAEITGVTEVVEAGPRQVEIAEDRLVVRAGLPLSFRFDGSNVSVDLPRDRLATIETAIRDAWAPVLDGPLREDNVFQGALLYLAKYVTPHPRGEPHFFVKPPALIATPPGWSTLVEGRIGFDHDVLRGVVRTDVFHAVPAVFSIATIGKQLRIADGAPLADLFPAPRSALDRPFVVRTLDALGRLENGADHA
ncbi:MAG: hypothetical protein HOW73_44760 [Polyangiaceae bacterium]|nr:hypothetical protein [Polyangiaceae bacterium]